MFIHQRQKGGPAMPGKRYSRQRELIYEAVKGTKEHPTAEMVYHWLKPANPNLSLGTVYRNLNLLAEEGYLMRMPFPVERYDADTAPHSHFRCKACGRVFDLDLPYDPELDSAALAAQPGFQIQEHSLLFSGLCPDCQS
jgi:Fur family peroxide stress response transcriptional regulator